MLGFARNNPTPLYLQVKASLQSEIASGKFAPGDPLPTERELASKLRLNRLTVRRALDELAREKVICRIPGRGTFLPGGATRNLKLRKPGAPKASEELVIALVAPYTQIAADGSSFYFRALQGMEAACALNVSLSLRRLEGDASALAARLKADEGVRGLIALSVPRRKQLESLTRAGLPMVVYDAAPADYFSHPGVDFVGHANEVGAFEATNALINLGHRQIACLVHATSNDPKTARASEVARERQRGYERAFASRKLPVPRKLIQPVIPSSACGYAAAQKMLRQSLRPTAFFTTVDELAIGALAGAKDLGLRVPEQVSVVGFGDLGHFSTPALSVVRLQIEASGRTAVQRLLERIAHPELPVRKEVLETEFIQRGTTGMPPA